MRTRSGIGSARRAAPAGRRAVSTGGRWLLSLALLGLGLLGPAPAAAQETPAAPLAADSLTVNVELILDVSGSMAERLPGTDQTRMAAAHEALLAVIDQIPARDGLNVGLRVYGQAGSNTQADRAVSCAATELLVPLAGVDRAALVAGVTGTAPTGWTPLTQALVDAGADFAPGESIANAIIMVTDGEETCDGDPCAAAAALHAADVALTTHVVGFALTPEQQAAVRCIAEEGGGQLFAADDAVSLGEAVFTAFRQVEAATPPPVETERTTGGYVAGDAFGLLAAGTPGELSVVAAALTASGDLALVIQNDTGAPVEDVEAAITARAGGELVAVGQAQGVQPWVVGDGEVAVAYGYFSGDEVPADAEFTYDLSADPAGTDKITGARDLTVIDVNGDEDQIIGIFQNDHAEDLEGFIIVAGICFDAAGVPTEYASGTVGGDILAAGDTLPFALSTALSDAPCAHYLVAGYGSAVP